MTSDDSLEQRLRKTGLYLWQSQQFAATTAYRSRRYQLLNGVLRAARDGALTPDWREQLGINKYSQPVLRSTGEAVETPPDNSHTDSAVLLIHEMGAMPQQAWEPYASAGDWRAALDAWYTTWLANQEYRAETADFTPPTSPIDIPGLRDIREKSRLRLKNGPAFVLLDRIMGASYRAGLAAGGDDVDWQTWLQQQPLPEGISSGPADWDRMRQTMEQLPEYWTSPGGS